MKTSHQFFRIRQALGFAAALVISGCATEAVHQDPRDPWEGWNRKVQWFNDNLDDYVMKPVAEGYQTVTPSFVDQGVTNFFSNVDDIAVVANDLLQFKLLQAGQDTGRLLLNSTFGLAGFMDVASTVDLPKHNEDLDQTLGAWGVPSGPYLVLPFLGPNTPRGVVGVAGDIAANPINWINPVAIPWGAGVLETVDLRADLLSATKIMDEASVDRYEFMRNAYFQQRNYLVHDGNPPVDEELEAEFDIEGLDTESTPEPEEVVPPSEPGTPLPSHY